MSRKKSSPIFSSWFGRLQHPSAVGLVTPCTELNKIKLTVPSALPLALICHCTPLTRSSSSTFPFPGSFSFRSCSNHDLRFSSFLNTLVRPAAPPTRLSCCTSESAGWCSCFQCSGHAEHDHVSLGDNRDHRGHRSFDIRGQEPYVAPHAISNVLQRRNSLMAQNTHHDAHEKTCGTTRGWIGSHIAKSWSDESMTSVHMVTVTQHRAVHTKLMSVRFCPEPLFPPRYQPDFLVLSACPNGGGYTLRIPAPGTMHATRRCCSGSAKTVQWSGGRRVQRHVIHAPRSPAGHRQWSVEQRVYRSPLPENPELNCPRQKQNKHDAKHEASHHHTSGPEQEIGENWQVGHVVQFQGICSCP